LARKAFILGTKALLVGLDGFDDRLTGEMIAEGNLPNFKTLRDSSHQAKIRNYPGMGAGVFWASAACGVTPDQHGRYFHLQFDPHNYDVRPFAEDKNFRAPAFWKSLDDEGRRIAVLDWHRGPFQEMKNGFLLDNWLGHDSTSDTRSYPPEMTKTVFENYGGDPFAGGSWNRLFDSLDAHVEFIEQACSRIKKKTDLACDQMNASDWDLYAPCFSEIHDVGHYVYHITDTEHPLHKPELREVLGDPLRTCYAAADRALERMICAAGPDAAIMVLAGPGMMRLVSANTAIEEIARRLDLGEKAPRTSAEQAKYAYRSFMPEPFRRGMAPFARAVRRTFVDSVYARRRFFGIPHNDNSACIRINMKGREPLGVVEPGADFDRVVDELRQNLMEIEDADTGLKIVENVISIQHEYSGQNVDMLPDIFVEWNRDSNLKSIHRIRSPKIGEIEVPQSRRTGDHTTTGFFWAREAEGDIFSKPGWRRPHEVTEIIMNAVRMPGSLRAYCSSMK
jgi:predicted AlkP superfamily phosphohydrolase/phosphomutase